MSYYSFYRPTEGRRLSRPNPTLSQQTTCQQHFYMLRRLSSLSIRQPLDSSS